MKVIAPLSLVSYFKTVVCFLLCIVWTNLGYGQVDSSQNGYNDFIDDSSFASFENLPTTNIDIQEIGFLDKKVTRGYKRGKAAEMGKAINTRNKLVFDIIKTAVIITDRQMYRYPGESSDKPAQLGLGYSWGSKKYDVRQRPPGRDACEHQIYGLDCSGLIYQLFTQAGVKFIDGPADQQRLPETLRKFLAPYFQDKYFTVEDKGQLEVNKIQSGDIIYFFKTLQQGENKIKSAFHIGIALKLPKDEEVYFFESLGRPNDCSNNLGQNKGPRQVKLGSRLKNTNYGVVRIGSYLEDDN